MRKINARLSSLLLVLFMVPVIYSHAQSVQDLSAFIGTWKINPAKTKMGRNGPNGDNILRSKTFTFKFLSDARGVRMDVYAAYPQAEPTRSARVVTDGSILPCESKPSCLTIGGDPKDQTFAWYRMDSHMLARLFWVKGKPYDYSSMAVSSDGKTLVLISWAPDTPEYQNIQVFDKEETKENQGKEP